MRSLEHFHEISGLVWSGLLRLGSARFLLTRIFDELLSRGHEDGRATGQPQGVGSETYLHGTSQGPTPEDARKGAYIRGRSK